MSSISDFPSVINIGSHAFTLNKNYIANLLGITESEVPDIYKFKDDDSSDDSSSDESSNSSQYTPIISDPIGRNTSNYNRVYTYAFDISSSDSSNDSDSSEDSGDNYQYFDINQSAPIFSRYEEFDPNKYIAVAEEWGDDSAKGAGSSWESPLKTIPSSGDGKKILVFDGSYGGSSGPNYSGRTDIILVNGLDSVDNKHFDDKYTESYVVGTSGGISDNLDKKYYDKLNPVESQSQPTGNTFIRCTFTSKPIINGNTFIDCIFCYNGSLEDHNINNDNISNCIFGIKSDLGLDNNYRPIYGSIICGKGNSDFQCLDYEGKPRVRSGLDLGCYEYQYNFKPNNVNIIKNVPDDIQVISNPGYNVNNINWFDNSNSGYTFSIDINSQDINYNYGFYYDPGWIESIRKDNIYVENLSNIYLLIVESSNANIIFVDKFNYPNQNTVSTEELPIYLVGNTYKGLTKGFVCNNLQTAITSIGQDKTIVICRGVYELTSGLSINKNLNIESDAGADETIFICDGSDSTNRFMTITSGNVNITGITVMDSVSKRPISTTDNNRYGGAVSNIGSGTVNLIACRFQNCKANLGGSIYNCEAYNCIIDKSDIKDGYSYSIEGKLLTSDVHEWASSPVEAEVTYNFQVNSAIEYKLEVRLLKDYVGDSDIYCDGVLSYGINNGNLSNVFGNKRIGLMHDNGRNGHPLPIPNDIVSNLTGYISCSRIIVVPPSKPYDASKNFYMYFRYINASSNNITFKLTNIQTGGSSSTYASTLRLYQVKSDLNLPPEGLISYSKVNVNSSLYHCDIFNITRTGSMVLCKNGSLYNCIGYGNTNLGSDSIKEYSDLTDFDKKLYNIRLEDDIDISDSSDDNVDNTLDFNLCKRGYKTKS